MERSLAYVSDYIGEKSGVKPLGATGNTDEVVKEIDDVDGVPILLSSFNNYNEDIDGVPFESYNEVDDDIDGIPLSNEGYYDDDIDGVPFTIDPSENQNTAYDDDIDGVEYVDNAN